MRFRFGEFELDIGARLLLQGRTPLPLTPKAFALLELLLRRRPEVVPKDELLDALWPDAFVVEANLPNLVAEIRSALGDTARASQYVRTAHGAGYAFCGPAFEYRSPSTARVVLPTACVLIGQGRMIALGDGEHVVGRSSDCAVHLPSATVSRRHAEIRVAGRSAVIEDLQSSNGTFVRGRRIHAPAVLSDGDKVRIGDVSLRFRIFDPSATTRSLPLPAPSRLGAARRAPGRPRKILGRS